MRISVVLHVLGDKAVKDPSNDQDPKQPSEQPPSHHKGALVLEGEGATSQRYKLKTLKASLEWAAQVLKRHPLVGETDELDRRVPEYSSPALEMCNRRVGVLDQVMRSQAMAHLCFQPLWRLCQDHSMDRQCDWGSGNAPCDGHCAQRTEQQTSLEDPPITSVQMLHRQTLTA
jgi:hypothetical protein